MSLISASGYPECTNYTTTFKNTLDYVFVENGHFEVLGVGDMPDMNELSTHENDTLPSPHYPSDHLSILVDLKLL